MVDQVEFGNLDKLILCTQFILINFVNAHTPVWLIRYVLNWIMLPYKVSMSRECRDIVERRRAVKKLLIIIRCVNAHVSSKIDKRC